MHTPLSRRTRGLTLIEVLVALALWGLLTALMTQGLDGVVRSQQQQGTRDEQQAKLQNSLSQWQADLNQMDTALPPAISLDWNGRVLRLVRHSPYPSPGHRQVGAWGVREGRWVRWQSPPIVQRSELDGAWQSALDAFVLSASDDGAGRAQSDWLAVESWQVYYFRNDSWTNALSSTGAGAVRPDGIRLELDLTAQGSWQGKLRSDWVRPTWSVNRT